MGHWALSGFMAERNAHNALTEAQPIENEYVHVTLRCMNALLQYVLRQSGNGFVGSCSRRDGEIKVDRWIDF